MSKIVVAGSINMDVVAQTDRHPAPGETIFGHHLRYIPGGKGSNQAVAAARLHHDVFLIGKLGRDPFGDTLTEFLQQEHLNLDHLTYSDDTPSGVALITVNAASENTIVVVSGSNFRLSPQDVSHIPLNKDDIVASVFEIPQETILALFLRAQAVGAKTVLNPAPAATFIDGLLPLVDYLVVNETELAFFGNYRAASESVHEIEQQAATIRHSPNQIVVVTLGANGVACLSGGNMIRIPGIPVDAVDTTGAGDCFTGALATALSEHQPLEMALRFANTAASLSVQKLGAATSMPYRHEVDAAIGR